MPDQKILIVDDSPASRQSLREVLESAAAGHEIFEAENGAVGLKRAFEVCPDLIVSDLHMPVLDGQALCRCVRQNARLSSVPFIMVTTRTERESKISLLDVGVDDYLTKPVDARELIARVRSLLRLRWARLELEENHRALQLSKDRETLAHKAAFAGQLAVGLAHEFNNALGCMSADLAFLKPEMAKAFATATSSDPERWDRFVGDANDIVVSFERLIARMLTTVESIEQLRNATESGVSLVPVAMDKVVGDSVQTLADLLGRSPPVTVEGDTTLCAVVEPTDATGAFVLLLRFLVERGGDRPVTIAISREDREVVARVSAPGVEFEPGEAKSFFDPRLVANAERRMQLSVDMSVCASYISRSGGSIRASEEQTGASFEIRFALADDVVIASPLEA